MKPRKAISLFFCTVAFAASAATVSVDTAKLAAGSWARSNASLGVKHGTAVKSAVVGGTNCFYAVSFDGGGTLFLSTDDEIGPLLAFTASSEPDISEGSPLFDLLNHDVAARRKLADAETAQIASTSRVSFAATASSPSAGAAAQRGAEMQKAKKLWSALTATAAQSSAQPSGGRVLFGATASPQTVLADSDIRVDPILTTQWSQTDVNGKACYNYYTPPFAAGSANNYPCGCVATAAGQILNRWKYPTDELPSFSNNCTVDGGTVTLWSVGDTRLYDWSSMVDKPNGATSDASRRAIGALLSDLGVSFGADYSEEGTGAYEEDVPGPLHQHFKYASAYTYTVNGTGNYASSLHTDAVRQRTVLANLDAKRPVELYILSTRAGGHAVVADGYGYVTMGGEEIEFTHINMGWAGTDDLWYNLPVIQTKEAGSTAGQSGGYKFEYLMGATFNIHPTETGDLLTGRIIDDDEPVEGAVVTVMEAGSPVVIANTASDARGIYSFCLEGGKTYDVMAVSADGKKSGTVDGVYLKKTTVADTVTYTTKNDSDVGNSWGNDIDIVVPHVRTIVGTVTNLYPNLNTALAAVSTNENPIVEIFGPTRLKNPVTITTNVTIRTIPDYSADFETVLPTLAECEVSVTDAAITAGGWGLQVADGVRVDFSNIVVRAESGEPLVLDVLETGKAAFAGRVDIGKVVTRTADAFVLAGAFEPAGSGLAVSYPNAKARFSQFGTYECSDGDAESCATLIVDALDPTMTGSVGAGGTLVWNRVDIDPTIAIAYATNDTFGVTHYLSVDQLFEDYASGAEVVFLRNCPEDKFTNSVVVAKSMSIRSVGGAPFVVTAGNNAGFTVHGGDTELVFTNIVFTRAKVSSSNFVTVRDGASFTLADGATIADLSLAGTASAVYVENGLVTMQEGSAITNCTAASGGSQTGVAVSLGGEGCELEMSGGMISGCKGGRRTLSASAVYAAIESKIFVSGAASVFGNTNYNGNQRDIYITSTNQLTVTGRLEGKIGVFRNTMTAAGNMFAVAGSGLSAVDAESSFSAFVNNANATTLPSISGDGTKFLWVAKPSGPVQVAPGVADVDIVVNDVASHYAKIEEAFLLATNATQTIRLRKDLSLTNDLAVCAGCEVVLDGGGCSIVRGGNFSIAVADGASLAVTNVTLNGGIGIGRIIDVKRGSLTLDDGAIVEDVNGTNTTACVAAIVVWGGTFTMNSGSAIRNCRNPFVRELGGPLAAGGVVAQNYGTMAAEVYLNGGEIAGCLGAGNGVGGIFIGNGAAVHVKGDASVKGNTANGRASNLVVQDLSSLVLENFLSGRIGYSEGANGDTNVFGTVDAGFLASATPSNVVVSARRFRNDETNAKGMVATNGTEALLVWSSAIGDSFEYTNVVDNVTNVYSVVNVAVDDDPDVVACAPFAFTSLAETTPGKWRLTLKPGTEYCVYTLKTSDDLATWTTVGYPKTLFAGDIGSKEEFVFEVDIGEVRKFWKVEGVDGMK